MTTPTTTTSTTSTTVRAAGNGARVRTLPTADRIADAELRRFVQELTDIARLELSRAGRRRPAVIKQTKDVTVLARRLGVDLSSDRPIVQQLDLRKAMPVTRTLAQRSAPTPATPATTPRLGATVSRGVRFMVQSVRSDDETDPEWIGKDDIALGGFVLAADGTTTAIEERFVGKFNDRDKVVFDPPLELANISLRNVTFPATVGVIVGLAEKDLGGFSKFLADAFDDVKDLIKVVFETVGAGLGLIVGAKIGAELGTAVGTAVGGPIGAIIGLLAGIVLGAIIGGVVAAARDDVFVPATTTVSLDAPDATFPDGSDAADVGLSFAGFGGRYSVTGRWTLVR